MIRRRQQRGSVGTCRYHGAPMTPLTHDRYCDEVITQTGLLRDILQGADLSLTVPTCPDWTLARLVRHIGGNLRSVETAVRTGRAVEDPVRQVPDAAGSDGDDPATLDAWLADAAQKSTVALRGPLADVLRVFHRRLPADSERVEVVGDAALLDFWLERVSLR